mgnify:CR=1 FL=1
MIYLDSAATTYQKPPAVFRAVRGAMASMTSPGRGTYGPAARASRTLLACREEAARLFHVPDPERAILTFNATHGLNIAIKSLVPPGGKAVISGYEHNAVTRPLHAIPGLSVTVIDTPPFRPDLAAEEFCRAIRQKRPRAVICTHVSNVFGAVLPVEDIARCCRETDTPLIVDASQSAGVLPVDLAGWGAAFVAMPGHKGLYGPQGTGLLLCGAEGKPLLYGGTGSMSRLQDMPPDLPDRLEPGTHNMPGIAGLLEGIRFVRRQGVETIAARERQVALRAARGLESLPGVRVFWDRELRHQTGVVSFVTEGRDCEAVGEALARRGIALRAGLHCAPLAHRTAGTLETGTLRLSTSFFNTPDQADRLVWAVSRVLRENVEL